MAGTSSNFRTPLSRARGMGAAKHYGVPMPAAAATRESVSALVGRGYDDVDFAILLKEIATASGLKIKSENKKVPDGLGH